MPRLASLASVGRILKPRFHTQKKRVKHRWKKRKRNTARRNLVLFLLTGDRGTIRRLTERTGLCERTVISTLQGINVGVTAKTVRLMARGLGVSTDLFLDVLEAYTGWPNAPKRVKKNKSAEAQETSVPIAEKLPDSPKSEP